MADVYGIDLGTTYSCIAKLDSKGYPVIIQDDENAKDAMPSAVFYLDNGNIVVGECAKEAGFEYPERLCQHFKRYIGRNELKLEDRDRSERYIIDGVPKDPIELSAIVLKKIVDYAKCSGEDVRDVVIACPAYFDFAQLEATKRAAELIGLEVLGIVLEPLAAVTYYSDYKNILGRNILVFDLGGATLDISLVHPSYNIKTGKSLDIEYTLGDSRLGGEDWDACIRELLIDKLCAATFCNREDIPEDTLYEIYAKAENVKQKLTFKESCKVRIQCNGNSERLELTRAEFEEKALPLMDRITHHIDSALQATGYSEDDLDVVLAVGGASLMAMVRKMLHDRFGEKVVFDHPSEAIAKGAAIAAREIVGLKKTNGCNKNWPLKLADAEKSIRTLILEGKAHYVYDQQHDKIRLIYEDEYEAHENPEIARTLNEMKNILEELFSIHNRVETLRKMIGRTFYATERAEELASQLNNLVANQKRIDILLKLLDPLDKLTK